MTDIVLTVPAIPRLGLLLAAVALSSVAVVTVGDAGTEAAGTIPTQYLNDPAERPLGAITVIGDSVLLGALSYSPTLVDTLAADGWGPIRARGGMGYSTGYFQTPEWSRSSDWIEKWRAEGWDAPNVVVNLGVNDAGLCRGDLDCSVSAIEHLLDAIGPEHQVWWANITRSAAGGRDYQASWNAALADVAARRSELTVWDWASEYASGEYPSGDRIHLSPDGYRARNRVMTANISATLVRTERTGTSVDLPTSSSGEPVGFVSLEPSRVIDTRLLGDQPTAGSIVRVDLSESISDTATAVAVNVTSTGTSEPGFLTVFPCDEDLPDTSTVNHDGGVDRGAFTMARIGNDRSLCVFTAARGHVIVDLQGYFDPDGTQLFTPLSTPTRLIDTRISGRAPVGEALIVPVPEDAVAVSVTVTGTDADEAGFITVHPCVEAVPNVSSVNHGVAEPVAGSAIVQTNQTNQFCVTTSGRVDVIVDLTGVFKEGEGNRFVPVSPTRLLDTRVGTGGWGPRHARDARIEIPAAPTEAVAVSGTITIVRPASFGYLTAEPCGASSSTSSVNANANGTMANSITVGTTDGSLCITANSSTHTLFDVAGWWIP